MESDMHRSDEFQLMLYKQWAEQNDFLLCALQSTVLLEYRWHRHLIPLNLLDHKPLVMEPLNLLDLIEAKLCNFSPSFSTVAAPFAFSGGNFFTMPITHLWWQSVLQYYCTYDIINWTLRKRVGQLLDWLFLDCHTVWNFLIVLQWVQEQGKVCSGLRTDRLALWIRTEKGRGRDWSIDP